MKFKLIIIGISMTFFTSCSSVSKYNTQVTKKHSQSELIDDIDYAYKKLKKLHPELDLYLSKDSLDASFNFLKKEMTKPMTSLEFYNYFAPVITKIKQGHTTISPPYKKLTKKERKLKLFRSNPFRQFRFASVKDKIFILKNFGKDSTILEGSELLKINNENVNDLTSSFKNYVTADGFNQTFVPMVIKNYIGSLYIKTHGLKDSIAITLQKEDSIYTKFIYALPKKYKKKKSTKQIATKKQSKAEKKLAKEKKEKREDWEFKYGYNKLTKETNRNFKFIAIDSSNRVGYMKIRGFGNGNYKDFYLESFAKLDSSNCKYFIIDLRNNGGGRLDEIAHLYSYLTDKEYVFINKSKMTKRSSWLYPFLHSKSIGMKTAVIALYPVAKIVELFKVKSIDGVPYFKFNSSKKKNPNLAHNYQEKIYVLINPLSFSASSILANKLKSDGAFLVGDETGGANNSTVAGLFAPIELPNSKLRLRFGLTSLSTENKDSPNGYGVIPNKYIKVTTLDKDEQLDWILNSIKNEM